jgi:hypothetical protein
MIASQLRPNKYDIAAARLGLIARSSPRRRRTVRLKLEEMKRDFADPLIEAQRLVAKRFKHDAYLHQLSEKSETAKKALDKLMLQTIEQEQYHGQILASIEVLREP